MMKRPKVRDPKNSPVAFALGILGETGLYAWQMRALERVAAGKRVALIAANGSGKTDKVIAILALWFLWRYPKGRLPITSGSWRQVKDQLFPALEKHKANPAFKGWTWLKTCRIETAEGGFIEGFSTNHAGKAEGWHGNVTQSFKDAREQPHEITLDEIKEIGEQSADAPVFFIVDEAKTVPDPIFDAIERCTLQFCLYTSSPGKPFGQFYRCFHEDKSLFSPIRATAFDCPHISTDRIKRMLVRCGEDETHPLYRSAILAEFTMGDSRMIIDPEKLEEGQRIKPERLYGRKSYFFDVAAGGDENVLAWADDNYTGIVYTEKQRDTVQGVRTCIAKLKALGANASDVWVDSSGLGMAVVSQFREEHWYVNEFLGNATSNEPKVYANLIAEVWHDAGLELTAGHYHIDNLEPVLFKQLTDRMSEYSEGSKIRNESKDAMKERGTKSPDRADAVLGAIWAKKKGRTGVFTSSSDILTENAEICVC